MEKLLSRWAGTRLVLAWEGLWAANPLPRLHGFDGIIQTN
jgi:hypothetical protein